MTQQLPSMNVNSLPQGGVNNDPVPAGLHACRIIRIADVGTVPNQYRPQDQPKHKLRIGFEVTDFQVQWNNNGQDVMGNALAYKTVTLSSGDKAILPRLFRAADPTGQLTGGEIWNLIGLPLLVQFTPMQDGMGTFVDSFAPLMPGMQVPNPTVETWCFSVAAPDPAVWAKLNNTIKDMVKSNVHGGAELYAQMEAATGNTSGPVQAQPQQFSPQHTPPPDQRTQVAQPQYQQPPQQQPQPAYQAQPQQAQPQYQAPAQAPQQAPAQAQPQYQAPASPPQGQPGQLPSNYGGVQNYQAPAQQPQQPVYQQPAAQPQPQYQQPQQAPVQAQGQPQGGQLQQPAPGGMDFSDDIAF